MIQRKPRQRIKDVPSDATPSYDPAQLRKRAEKRVEAVAIHQIDNQSPEEIGRLLHELQVHQIELEMQNEELRRSQVELDASRARYFDLYDLAPVGYCTVTPRGMILESNLTAANLLGTERRTLASQHFSRFIFRDDQDIFTSYRRRLIETGLPQSCELRLVKDGAEPFWAQLQGTVVDAEDGRLVCRLVLTEITERKRAEEALNEREAQHRSVINTAMDGFWRTDTRGRLLEVNETYCRMSGYSEQELLSMAVTDLEAVETTDETAAHIREVIARGEDRFETRHRRKDGTIVEIEASVQYRPAGGGQLVSFLRDISARRKQEEERLHLARTLRALSNVNRAVMHIESEEDLLNEVCRLVSEDCGHPMVWIGFKQQDAGSTVAPVAQAGFEERYLESVKISWSDSVRGRGPTGVAIRTGSCDICQNFLDDPRMEPWREEALKSGFASSIALPLMDEGQAFGALTIYAREVEAFPPAEVKLLSELADNLAFGVTTLRVRKAHQKSAAALLESETRFRLLSKMAAQLLVADDPLEIVRVLARDVMIHLDCHAFFNFVVDERAGKLRLNAYAGIPDEEARKIEWLDYGMSVCGCVAQGGAHIVTGDILSIYDPRTELVRSFGIRAYACHPLMAGGRVIGTLSFGTKTRNRFSDEDLELMKTMSDQVAVAMERMRLVKELEDSRDELEARVRRRTADLAKANVELNEIARVLRDSDEKLRRYNELLQKVFDGITDPLLMIDSGGLLSMSNRAARDYYGIGEDEEVLGKPCFEGLRRREAPCPGCMYPFQTTGDQTVSFERKGIEKPDRTENVTVYPVLDKNGERESVIVRSSDVTQAKILERQILQNEKLAALGLVTSGIAHEINNPNTFIYFNLPILRKYLHELIPVVDEHAALHPGFEVLHMPYGEVREDLFKLIENMEHGSHRINKIIGVLNGFLRKKEIGDMQEVDLKQLVEKVVALCSAQIRQKLSSFEIAVVEGLPTLISDPEVLQQVLINLLINAIHACDKPESRVSLKVEKGASDLEAFVIEVTDNGTGIEDAVRARIFDPFFTTKSPALGTGLGLYICLNHVTALGGRIEVESLVGQGTTFRVVLPQNAKSPGDDSRPN